METFPNNPKYKIIKKLGQGAFGSAFKVLNIINNDIYVIKQISVKNTSEKDFTPFFLCFSRFYS